MPVIVLKDHSNDSTTALVNETVTEDHDFIKSVDLSVPSTVSSHDDSSHIKTVSELTTVSETTAAPVDKMPGHIDSSNETVSEITVDLVDILAKIESGTTLNPVNNDTFFDETLSAPTTDIADKLSSCNDSFCVKHVFDVSSALTIGTVDKLSAIQDSITFAAVMVKDNVTSSNDNGSSFSIEFHDGNIGSGSGIPSDNFQFTTNSGIDESSSVMVTSVIPTLAKNISDTCDPLSSVRPDFPAVIPTSQIFLSLGCPDYM